MKKRISIYLLLVVLLTMSFANVYANTVEDLRNQQKDVNQQMEETKNQIQEIEGQTRDISREIADLDRKVVEARIDLEKVEGELKTIENNIVKTEGDLLEAERNLDQRQESFNKRLRVMYMNGNVGYLEVLLASSDIKDLLSRQDMLQSIAEHDRELIEFMKEQRDIIERKKVELEAQRASVEVTRSKITARERDLVRVTREKEDLMGRLERDIKTLETQYDSLNKYAEEIQGKILSLQSQGQAYTGGRMAWPVPGYNRISSQYGYRIHPIFQTRKLHTGIDIPAPTGTPVTAAADGTVVYSDWLGGYGMVVMIDHGGGIVTLYAHNSSLVGKNGQSVKRGDTVARIGSTGFSTGPHLHFEVRENGQYVDPITWLRGN